MVRISDIELLKLLRENSRMSFVEMAKKLGVTEGAVRKRIKKLEKDRVIKGYTIVVDPKKLGYEIDSFIGLDTLPEKLISVVNQIKEMNEVLSLYISGGDHMILMECWFKSHEELNRFVRKIEKIVGVTRVCPATIINKVK